jgi:hypothetical protein
MLDLGKESLGEGFWGHFMGLSQHLNENLTLKPCLMRDRRWREINKAPAGARSTVFETGFESF